MATSDLKREIEEAIRASISRRFSIVVKDVSLVTQPSVSILIDLDGQASGEKSFEEDLRTHICKLLSLFDIADPKIIIQQEENRLPSPLIILQTMKILAPLSVDRLGLRLRENGYTHVTDDWVQQRLDALRKQHFVTRRPDTKYVLTYHGLVKLGSQRDRGSTDVRRALEMARWKY